MEISKYTQDELLLMWRPQAIQMAENGKGETTISHFLGSKGITEVAAKAAASEIVSEGKRNNFRLQLPLKVFGWIFIVIGVAAPLVMLLIGRGFIVISLAPVALGSAMVWGGYGTGED